MTRDGAYRDKNVHAHQTWLQALQDLVVKTVLFILGRSFHSASRLDPDIKSEIADWEEGFRFMMKVYPGGLG